MKKIRSVLAGLLAVCLLICAASARTFPDVAKDSVYRAAIEYVSELGIITGDTQGNFNPDRIVNRAQMAAIVCRMLGQTDNLSRSNVFTDVPVDHWANANIKKASELGIVGGYGNGTFGPANPVTYEQAVTMIVRAIGEGDQANSNGGYPNGFIKVAQEKNLLNGIQAVKGQGLSRGAVAMLLYNYYTTQNNPGTSSDVGEHTHNWVTNEIPEVGHTEQVIVGYDKKPVYETHWMYECKNCHGVFSSSEIRPHQEDFYNVTNCTGAGSWMYEQKVQVGEEETPIYENKWVVDTPASTVQTCSICGATK